MCFDVKFLIFVSKLLKIKDMKLVVKFCAVALLVFIGCKDGKKESTEVAVPAQELAYTSFGDKISF